MANDNGWGDGVLNNTIGWGQGSDNNTIGWGSVYGESEAGLTALEGAGGGTIPVISGVPTISAESQVGETITATAASATGDPTPTTSWTWQRSADGSTGWADIIGATSITYTLVAADDANYVRAVQTETNALGSDSANSLASAQIADFSFGNALSFDGVNDNVSFTAVNKPALAVGFSVSMWVKFNATPSSEFILGNSASIYNQLLFISPTQAYFRTRAAGASITYFNFPAISTGTWYYIAVSLVTTVNELWIDGVKYTGTTHNYDNENITFNQIGLSGTSYGQFVIDELALKAGSGLTQQNVDDLYNGGLGQFATDVITDPDIYYRLNGSGTDITAIDDSGNSNTGTLNNFTGTYWVEHNALDSDAQAYITAAGITDATEQAAVNQLVLDLKGTGSTTNNTDVWSDSYAVYPLSPTSLTAAEYNLKDPTTNITWFNSPTHATSGITGNGTDAYGDTNWNPTTEGVDINNAGLTYSGEYSDVDYALGVYNSVRWFVIRNSANRKISYIGASSAAANPIDFNRSISTAVRTSGTLIKMYTNGTQSSSNSASSGGSVVPNANFFLLGYSNSGALSAPFAGEMDFAAIHKGLTANQAKDLSDAITTYNTAVR
jgi:hypothetical protein